MLPEARSEDLIYLSEYVGSGQSIYVYDYLSGKLVGTLSGLRGAQGLCVNRAGDVFVPELHGQDIVEYAHGSTEPKARLNDEGFAPNSCDVDPTTGNLAVANYCGKSVSDCVGSNSGNLVIYRKARGNPIQYGTAKMATYSFCGYDSTGDLFADGSGSPSDTGFHFVELHRGSMELTIISLNKNPAGPAGVQWDGAHIVIGDATFRLLDQYNITGRKGTEVGSTSIPNTSFAQFWITRNKVLATSATYYKSWIKFFDYPAGGKPARRLSGPRAYGITVSRAPR
jgi:hypothetical protein